MNDAELARFLAVETGKRLLDVRQRLYHDGASEWFAKDVGDAAAQRFIDETLAEHRPDDAMLSEEAVDDPRRSSADRVWIIDPLDGTQEYSEFDRVDWAVHIALWERTDSGGRLTAAAVSMPALELTLTMDPPPHPPAAYDGRPRLVVSRSRASLDVIRVAERLECDVIRMGSAGAKAMAVVLGEADIYVHSGGQHQWDSAAPVGVARAAGLHTSRINGSELVYNQRDSWLPDLIICRQHLARPVLAALGHGTIGV